MGATEVVSKEGTPGEGTIEAGVMARTK